jgi:hypothetical protein
MNFSFNNKQDAQDGLTKLEDDIYHHNSHNMDPLGVGELVVGGEEQQHVALDILFPVSSWLQKNVHTYIITYNIYLSEVCSHFIQKKLTLIYSQFLLLLKNYFIYFFNVEELMSYLFVLANIDIKISVH